MQEKQEKNNIRIVNFKFSIGKTLLCNYYVQINPSIEVEYLNNYLKNCPISLEIEDFGNVLAYNNDFIDGNCTNKLEIKGAVLNLMLRTIEDNKSLLI